MLPERALREVLRFGRFGWPEDQWDEIERIATAQVERDWSPQTLTGDAWRAAWVAKLAASASVG